MRNPVAWLAWLGELVLGRRPATPAAAGPEAFPDLSYPPDWEALREQALALFRQSIEAAYRKGDDG